jgi:hypothetical protein
MGSFSTRTVVIRGRYQTIQNLLKFTNRLLKNEKLYAGYALNHKKKMRREEERRKWRMGRGEEGRDCKSSRPPVFKQV